jgi:uncharacterized protein (UPF0333 family)
MPDVRHIVDKMRVGKRAQAATEYMMIAAVIMAGSGIVFFYALQYSQNSIAVTKVSESAETVAAAVDYVYSLGYGTQTLVNIELSGIVESSKVADREIMFVVRVSGKKSDIVAPTTAIATGTLPTEKGTHLVLVNYTETGVVVG